MGPHTSRTSKWEVRGERVIMLGFILHSPPGCILYHEVESWLLLHTCILVTFSRVVVSDVRWHYEVRDLQCKRVIYIRENECQVWLATSYLLWVSRYFAILQYYTHNIVSFRQTRSIMLKHVCRQPLKKKKLGNDLRQKRAPTMLHPQTFPLKLTPIGSFYIQTSNIVWSEVGLLNGSWTSSFALQIMFIFTACNRSFFNHCPYCDLYLDEILDWLRYFKTEFVAHYVPIHP